MPSYIKPLGLENNEYPKHWLTEKEDKNISNLNLNFFLVYCEDIYTYKMNPVLILHFFYKKRKPILTATKSTRDAVRKARILFGNIFKFKKLPTCPPIKTVINKYQ